MTLLDELSGFEFEETMAVVFERLGYEDVEVSPRVADTGRDIIMTDHDGETAVVVECKHTDVVGRPVIQKLDSAVSTYDHDGPTRGLIATTGRLTQPAREYARAVDIEVLDGRRLRQIADEIGMDLYNGRIEVICEAMLPLAEPDAHLAPIRSVVEDVENLPWETVTDPATTVTLVPTVVATTHVRRAFETGAGVVHRLDERETHAIDASRGGPERVDPAVASLVTSHRDERVPIDEADLEATYGTVNRRRFGRTETEYREHLVEAAIRRHTTTVTYTGDNNVTYEKVCEPNPSDVTIESFDAVYTPRVYAEFDLEGRPYAVDWFAASDEHAITEETVRSCRVCEDEAAEDPLDLATVRGRLSKALGDTRYTYCANCGRIACQAHIRTDRVAEAPVCTACAVSDRFFGARRYFYDETNREAFTEEYRNRPLTGKVRENAAGIALAAILVILLVVTLLAG
ncbi:MAG: restriction endonuclease [Halobacteriales archaeon]